MLQSAKFIIFLAALTVSWAAAAQEIYKRVGEDGVVEYSDTPAPDAQEIEVDPNVTEMAPEQRTFSAPEASEPRAAAPAPAEEPELSGDRAYNIQRDRNKALALEQALQREPGKANGAVVERAGGVRRPAR